MTAPAFPRTVAVWQHATRHIAETIAADVCRRLVERGLQVAAPEEDRRALQAHLGDVEVLGLDGQDCELGLVFGGDGSILRAAEWAREHRVPLLGVNLGHVGFLAELDGANWADVVDAVVDRSYRIEQRTTLRVDARDEAGHVFWTSEAVNEVSMEKSARERMLEVEVRIDSIPLSRWGCDGVLVATPTGSTAYAFSAGGPVVFPNVEALLVVPVSAHALFNRPVLVGPGSTVEVELVETAETEGVVWCDGRRSTPLRGGTTIEVSIGAEPLLLARVTDETFTSRLQRKFGLRVEGFRGAAEVEGTAC